MMPVLEEEVRYDWKRWKRMPGVPSPCSKALAMSDGCLSCASYWIGAVGQRAERGLEDWSQSAMSQHLAVLRQDELVAARKEAQTVCTPAQPCEVRAR